MTNEPNRPAGFLAGMWIAAIVLTVSCASEVSAWLMHDRTLGA